MQLEDCTFRKKAYNKPMEISDIIFHLSEEDTEWWKKKIKYFRKKLVKKPNEYVEKAISDSSITDSDIAENPNVLIRKIRECAWNLYIQDEVKFHDEVLAFLIQNQAYPAEILKKLIKENFSDLIKFNFAENKTVERFSRLVGDYVGRIMPYIYQLTLSTTNSRRSRSGKTFEAIIKKVFTCRKIPFEDQKSLGKAFYAVNKLGKIVDMIVPSKEAYRHNRRETLIVTMKTSLRERWAEVAEEIQRTSIPNIHLLTVDEDLSLPLIQLMNNYNITLVIYDESKKKKFEEEGNVKGYTEFFTKEIPHYLSYRYN